MQGVRIQCCPCDVMLKNLFTVIAVLLSTQGTQSQDVHLPKPPQIPNQTAALLRVLPVRDVNHLAFLPSSQHIALTSDNLEIWDGTKGKRLHHVRVEEFPYLQVMSVAQRGGFIAALCFGDPDRDLGGSALAIWDLKAKKWARVQRASAGSDNDFAGLAVAPDGQTLATAQVSTATHDFRPESEKSGTLRLWDARSGQLQRTLARGRFYNIEFSPSGKIVTATTEKGVAMWDLLTGKRENLAVPGAAALRFSKDSNTLAVLRQSEGAHGNEIRFYRASSGALLRSIRVNWSEFHDYQFSPSGRTLLIAGGSSRNQNAQGKELDPARGEVLFYRVADGKLKSRLKVPGGREIFALALSGDAKTLVTAEYGDAKHGGVKIWRLGHFE
jgi:WD40 repeat protein